MFFNALSSVNMNSSNESAEQYVICISKLRCRLWFCESLGCLEHRPNKNKTLHHKTLIMRLEYNDTNSQHTAKANLQCSRAQEYFYTVTRVCKLFRLCKKMKTACRHCLQMWNHMAMAQDVTLQVCLEIACHTFFEISTLYQTWC